ncbi:hypothetical protein MKX03_012711 [Papaver bracteatum]|nr:hypothetical protein MKX03_012711 [Papaver bracteatum]
MREITIENLRGTNVKIALWGSAANQVGNDPIDCESVPLPVLFVVVPLLLRTTKVSKGTFKLVIQYFSMFFTCCILNKISNSKESNSRIITLSSTNATKVYADADIPEVVEI